MLQYTQHYNAFWGILRHRSIFYFFTVSVISLIYLLWITTSISSELNTVMHGGLKLMKQPRDVSPGTSEEMVCFSVSLPKISLKICTQIKIFWVIINLRTHINFHSNAHKLDMRYVNIWHKWVAKITCMFINWFWLTLHFCRCKLHIGYNPTKACCNGE